MTNLEKIQKAALARLDAGEDLEYILQDYADYEEELRPILEEAAGVSISSLMQSPKAPKAKLKAKNEPTTNLFLPVIGGLVVALAAGIFLLLGTNQQTSIPTPIAIPVTAIAATDSPLIIDSTSSAQIIEVNDSVCDNLGQQSLNMVQVEQQEVAQQGTTGSGGGTDAVTVESTAVSSGIVAMSTPSAISDMPSMPPAEAPIIDSSSSVGSTSGSSSGTTGSGGGGDSSTADDDKGGEGGSSAPLPADGTVSELGRSSESSETVVDATTTTTMGGMGTTGSPDMAYDESDVDVYGDAESEEAAGEPVSDIAVVSNNQAAIQPLNAGEIDDNADWDTYQEYRLNFLALPYFTYGVRDLDTTDRQVIRVVDSNGLPVLGACVQIYFGESFITASSTYATGLTLFFTNLSEATRYRESFIVKVTKAGVAAEAELDRSAIGGLTTVTLPLNQSQQSVQLDVVFLLDATGSMGDEIGQLQSNILTISSQLDTLPNNVDVRFGLVSYKDRGDEYVTRVYDFTDDVQLFQANLMMVEAGGGGDYPESLNEGFDRALNAVKWRGEDTIKIIFLVTDAPPHTDYPNDADYSILMQDALARGIKVHPIGGSQLGHSTEGEYILRQIAQFTMGHFLFLTYDGGVSGTVGEDRPDLNVGDARDEQGVGDYSVAQLDDLVLRLITDEIAALQGE